MSDTKEIDEIQPDNVGKIVVHEISDVMKKSYLDYAMSVIVQRALPDVKDGLKPVHRRILYAMHQMGLTHSSKFTKSAKVVGEIKEQIKEKKIKVFKYKAKSRYRKTKGHRQNKTRIIINKISLGK